jgi:hypothetical protein
MSAGYSLDTNASSGASGSITFGNKSYGGNQSQGVPAWAVVVVFALIAVVVLRRKKGG